MPTCFGVPRRNAEDHRGGGGGTLAIRVRCPVIRRDDCQERSVFGKELWGRKIASFSPLVSIGLPTRRAFENVSVKGHV